jgi:hypothetical protein
LQCNKNSARSLKNLSSSDFGVEYVVKNTFFSRCQLRAVPSLMKTVLFNVECSLLYTDIFFYSYVSKLGCNKKKNTNEKIGDQGDAFSHETPSYIFIYLQCN